jgi:UDP-N-acetylmuramate dehydrogenase
LSPPEGALSPDLAILAGRLGERACRDVPLGPRTTYRVGGPAALLVEVADPDELAELAAATAGLDVATLVIGRGSNLLVADAGFPGLALVLGEGFIAVDIEGTRVRAGAAASLPVVARRTVVAGLAGFEWAVGVPGSIGGAVRMNAGGHGSDMAATLVGIRAVDLRTGEDVQVAASTLSLGYRRSSLRAHQVVVSADLRLGAGDPARGAELLAEIVAWRRANQPGGANAGSVFVNPVGDSAGRLIDAAGCRGLRVGTAQVSTKHANFIQADEAGSADDVAALMALVRDRVARRHGVVLEPETHLVGFGPDHPLYHPAYHPGGLPLDPHAQPKVEG